MQRLVEGEGWSHLRAYQAVFFAYAALGAVHFGLACALSRNIELDGAPKVGNLGESEEEPLLSEEAEQSDEACEVERKRELNSMVPKLSSESRRIVAKLCLLFAVDSLASGLVPAQVEPTPCDR